jgi:type IV pilus assembly protein PilV
MRTWIAASTSRQGGATMIEVLVTLVVVTFGLLAVAGFVVKATGAGVDANARARALVLLEDMSQRLQNDKAEAASFVTGTLYGAAAQNCGSATGPALELCTWNNLLAGANDKLSSGSSSIGQFRGCVTQPYVGAPIYAVTVAWGAQVPGVAPADPCGQGAFGNDSLRRIVRTQVHVATLSA